jgi:hypothetical protein
MSNAQRTKGQDTTLIVSIDDAPQAGSFKKVEGFNWKPEQEIQDSNFLGEPESDYDIQHDGFSGSFTIHELENGAVTNVLKPMVAALAVGDTLPKVTLVFIKAYRDPSLQPAVLTFEGVKLIMTGQDAGDRKGYVKTAFSFKCKTMSIA